MVAIMPLFSSSRGICRIGIVPNAISRPTRDAMPRIESASPRMIALGMGVQVHQLKEELT